MYIHVRTCISLQTISLVVCDGHIFFANVHIIIIICSQVSSCTYMYIHVCNISSICAAKGSEETSNYAL